MDQSPQANKKDLIGFQCSPNTLRYLRGAMPWAILIAVITMLSALVFAAVHSWILVTYWHIPSFNYTISIIQLLLLCTNIIMNYIGLRAARTLYQAISKKDKSGFLRGWQDFALYFKIQGITLIITLLFYIFINYSGSR
jgi:hypothetical protein